MKSNSLLVALIFILGMSVSCVRQPADYESVKQENDSLRNVKLQLEREVDEYLASMNSIRNNIDNIKKTEKILSVQPSGAEFDDDLLTRINQDLAFLNELIRSNREELARLKSKAKNSNINLKELEETISQLSKALEEENAKVLALQQKLAEKEEMIAQLDTKVDEMGKNIEVLKTEGADKDKKINEQEVTIQSAYVAAYTAWYVFGTNKELKANKIVTKKGLFGGKKVMESEDFNKDYFVRIDTRSTKSIPLYSKNAKILTSHPKASYTLEKENGTFVLLITNPTEFWNMSKYLVIEVD